MAGQHAPHVRNPQDMKISWKPEINDQREGAFNIFHFFASAMARFTMSLPNLSSMRSRAAPSRSPRSVWA